MLSPLANPDYARLFAAQLIALLGTGLTTVALALLAYDLAGGDAGRVLGTALAIKMIAYVGLAPLAGTLAERLHRRGFLIVLNLARAALVASLVLVTEIWQIFALIFLMQACTAAFVPAFQATVPDLLPDEEEYTKALSLTRLTYDLENLLSPTLAAAALLWFSFNGLFALNALAFVVSTFLIAGTRIPAQQLAAREEPFLRRATHGIRTYLAIPRLRGLMALSMAAAAAGAMVLVNTVVYARAYLGLGERETALMLAAFGAGSMIAALAMPRLLRHFSDRPVMLAGGVLMTVALLAGLFLPTFAGALLIWAAIGLGFAAIGVPTGRLLVRSSAEADRPALFAAQFTISHACWLITYPLSGWLGGLSDLTPAFFWLAVLTLAATIAAAFVWSGD